MAANRRFAKDFGLRRRFRAIWQEAVRERRRSENERWLTSASIFRKTTIGRHLKVGFPKNRGWGFQSFGLRRLALFGLRRLALRLFGLRRLALRRPPWCTPRGLGFTQGLAGKIEPHRGMRLDGARLS